MRQGYHTVPVDVYCVLERLPVRVQGHLVLKCPSMGACFCLWMLSVLLASVLDCANSTVQTAEVSLSSFSVPHYGVSLVAWKDLEMT